MTQRRCLKATIYIYVPDRADSGDEKAFNYWLGRIPGRVQLFDENGERIQGKLKAFTNLGELSNILSRGVRTMWRRRPKN